MEKVKIGKTLVCPLGFGTYNFGVKRTSLNEDKKVLEKAIERGIEVIDTATMYGNEAFLGEALTGLRDKVFLISKVLPSSATYEGTKRALKQSLRDLRTSYLDLYFLHWQGATPLEETVRALEDLKKEGLILNWGLSNIDVPQIKALGEKALECAALEVLYNPLARGIEYDLIPYAKAQGMAVLAYSPLGEGGPYLLHNKAILEVAKRHGVSAACVLIAFSMREQGLISIPKTSSLSHLEDNLKALELKLDKDDLKLIDEEFKAPTFKVPLKLGW